MIEKEIEEKVDKEVKKELKSCSIFEDMLGYKNVFNNLKAKILKEKYNIDYKIEEEEGIIND